MALSKKDKLRLLTILLESRHGDLREQNLNRQGKGHFHVSGMGHEGLAALGFAMVEGDYVCPYYRDRGLVLSRGVASRELALDYFATRKGQSHGRQMPSHYSYAERRILAMSNMLIQKAISSSEYILVVNASVPATNWQQALPLLHVSHGSACRI